jgi:phosphohistidine phosphatase
MLTLYILRHAEAVSEQKDDKGRKLTPRGRAQAQAVGQALAGGGRPKPVLVLRSPAQRVKETVAGVQKSIPAMAAREVDGIYNASPDELYNIIRLHGGEASPLMLAGHNPGVSALARLLAGEGEPDALQRMLAGFTPAALAAIECPIERWSDLMPDVNRVAGFDYPAV